MTKKTLVYEFPRREGLENATPEEAAAVELIVTLLEGLYKLGVKQVTRKELFEMIGCDEVYPEDEDIIIELSEQYFEEKQLVHDLLNSKTKTLH